MRERPQGERTAEIPQLTANPGNILQAANGEIRKLANLPLQYQMEDCLVITKIINYF